LEEFATPEECLRADARLEDSTFGKIILVDLARWPDFARQFEPFRKAGSRLIALIGSSEGREPALRSGFDDYLLRPVSAAELALRLGRLSGGGGVVPERERQAAVGRLTSYFCHAVNNSMQTIRGSVDLALEEPNLSAGVAEYLAICRTETVNIGRKIDRLRQIYRPQTAPPLPLALGPLLHEVLAMAADELLLAGVAVREEIDPRLPSILGSEDQLSLAFLMVIFHLCEEFVQWGGGELRMRVDSGGGFVQVAFTPVPGTHPFKRSSEGSSEQRTGLEPVTLPPELEPARDLIQSQRGGVQVFGVGRERFMQVRLPAAGR
jgi:CheY-like chemotaxis protein